MKNRYVVSRDITVRAAIEQMERETIKAVVVTDAEGVVAGLFSNGDMRSFFLKGGALSANICEAMNPAPVLYRSVGEAKEESRTCKRVIYPIVDAQGRLTDVYDDACSEHDEIISDELRDVPLVIMAGGKGTRLYPYTKILPKPLIPIGELTITERILQSFRRYGCRSAVMVLNYKANMIKAYMNELDTDYAMDFVEETEFLGTAGGLKLVRDRLHSTFFLSNCDVLINADLECIFRTHKMKQNKITVVCSMKDVVIPYGVVETDSSGTITGMQEKPAFSFLINTGIYMIEPDVLDLIRDGEVIHMPDLAQRCMDCGEKVGVFPISDRAWMDMGQLGEMESMMKNLGIK